MALCLLYAAPVPNARADDAWSRAAAELDAETLSALRTIESACGGVWGFYASLYDPATGGFFESPRDAAAGGEPGLESTGRVILALSREGRMAELAEPKRDRFAAFFLERQDPETGFFRDATVGRTGRGDRDLGRLVMYAVAVLDVLGREPRHALPGRGDAAAPARLVSPEAFVEWIDARRWARGWQACGDVASQAALIDALDEPLRSTLFHAGADALDRRQADDGFWGGGSPYVRLSGAFKATSFYAKAMRPIPRPAAIYASVLHTLRNVEPAHACFCRNPMDLLARLDAHGFDIPDADRREVVRIVAANVVSFAADDGGFRFERGHAHGSTNGVSQALKTRRESWRLLGLDPPPLPAFDAFSLDPPAPP